MLDLTLTTPQDLDEVTAFLRVADLTLSGLDFPTVRLWTARDAETGRIVASTGYERSDDNEHVLIRSVAVDPARSGKRSDSSRQTGTNSRSHSRRRIRCDSLQKPDSSNAKWRGADSSKGIRRMLPPLLDRRGNPIRDGHVSG